MKNKISWWRGAGYLAIGLLGIELTLPEIADARAFVGGARGGGYRGVSRTTYRPGYGVSRTTARSGYRYGHVSTMPAYRPGYTPRAVARRTTRRVTRRTAYAYGTAGTYGYASGYYYGTPTYSQPSGCTEVLFEGQTAYDCSGTTYVVSVVDGQYVYTPVE